jgi:heme A synthase
MPEGTTTSKSKVWFARFTWGVLGYNLAVILWGAWVRVTGSGAGCGAHWPTCNGEIVPLAPQTSTLIEYIHRLTSGLTLVLAVVLIIWAWRAYEKGHLVRLGAGLVLLFTLTEALVGAGLVLFQLVAHNASVIRVISQAVHLTNTLLLVASITLTGWWAALAGRPSLRFKGQGLAGWLLVLGLAWMILVSASGAVTALGDTLFPSESLASGLAQDINPTASFLIRLRVIHPILAVSLAVYIGSVVIWLRRLCQGMAIQTISKALTGIVVLQVVLGAINVILLAPGWMQLLHLLVSDLAWIGLVLFAANFFTPGFYTP